jgi:hypothetical protein
MDDDDDDDDDDDTCVSRLEYVMCCGETIAQIYWHS